MHRIAISQDSGQNPSSDLHSTIRPYSPIVVIGESDYLLLSPYTHAVKGICEAKSSWNVEPSEIDDVIDGAQLLK